MLYYLLRDSLEAIKLDQAHAIHHNQYSIRNGNIHDAVSKYLAQEKKCEREKRFRKNAKHQGYLILTLA